MTTGGVVISDVSTDGLTDNSRGNKNIIHEVHMLVIG